MLGILRRRDPNATELLAYAMSRRDYRAAAVLLCAGALETVSDINATQAQPDKDNTAALALQRIRT